MYGKCIDWYADSVRRERLISEWCSLIPHKETENGKSKEAKTGRQVDKSKEAREVATGLNTVSPATPVGCHRVNPEDVVNAGGKMKLSLV